MLNRHTIIYNRLQYTQSCLPSLPITLLDRGGNPKTRNLKSHTPLSPVLNRPTHHPTYRMADTRSSPTFYMRELPKEHLTGYDTTEGKRLFSRALAEGGLESFFPLSQQFLTQNEPAYCGIGTLCMILNALKVDPTVTWRKPWRWFTQEMLDCCQPLEVVKEKGITLAEFSCLAKCNGLEATTRFADQTSFEEFHEAVRSCTFSSEQLMAVSYSRASLGQTGAGHFSPVGGYTSDSEGMVLILDVARFKYPSYWVPIKKLYDALIPKDPVTNQPRGYSMLRRRRTDASSPNPTSPLFRLDATKATWPAISTPLYAAANTATTHPALVQALTHALADGTISPVTSRNNDGSDTPPSSQCVGLPAFDTARTKHDYEARLDSFASHLSSASTMYKTLPATPARMELTIFFLALFSTRPFLLELQPVVKKAAMEVTEKDLGDKRVVGEVVAVRRQMESLEKCVLDEGGCSSCTCRGN